MGLSPKREIHELRERRRVVSASIVLSVPGCARRARVDIVSIYVSQESGSPIASTLLSATHGRDTAVLSAALAAEPIVRRLAYV